MTLVLRLAHNYKLQDLAEVKEYIETIVKAKMESEHQDFKLLESLISIG
jgi:hypothetical protein